MNNSKHFANLVQGLGIVYSGPEAKFIAEAIEGLIDEKIKKIKSHRHYGDGAGQQIPSAAPKGKE